VAHRPHAHMDELHRFKQATNYNIDIGILLSFSTTILSNTGISLYYK